MEDFIQTIHKTTYRGIDAAAPPRTQRGKTVLITGGVRGIGFAIARAFAVANASTIILLSRGGDKLSAAEARLKGEVPSFSGVVMTIRCDILDPEEIASVWSSLHGCRVDVLILNAAYMGENQAVLQHSWRRVWEQYEVNVRGNLVLVDLFVRQGNTHDGQKKFLVNLSSDAINNYAVMGGQRVYAATKASWTCLLQHLASEFPVDEVQIINVHPGGVYTETISQMMTKEVYDWDDDTLPGNFAVWAATDEASFLHGRYCWAGWDVQELKEALSKERRSESQDFLKVGVIGMRIE
ncbi:hypothetical protein N7444_009374 [Penicillium canescens]|nr:hypothetical protein N7444_009374 [Penicillium canescens]